jgi:hypothetical protein
MNKLDPQVINLNIAKSGRLDESFLAMFGGAIEMILTRMFTGAESPLKIRGTPSQISSFSDALAKEKSYMESFMTHGLSDPRSFTSRHELERAVANFERETGIIWPFR